VIAPTTRREPVRVVLDTNVLLSGIFFGGLPGRILSAWQASQVELVLSPAILTEYHTAAARLSARYRAIEVPLDAIISRLAQAAVIVDAPDLPVRVSGDAADDKFLACALAAGVPIIVSGDKHLLAMAGWGGINVLKPRQFVEQHLKRSP
jgi:putative PIN family toxin of toxin-antitoxin system